MTGWTREHRGLLAALRASAIVPPLVRRLSLERVSPDDAEIRRLRGWASALRADPGWSAIEQLIEAPEAWPQAWDAAVALGFSPTCDHHHALLFGGFCERFVAAHDWEGAGWTWRQAIDAWARVFASDYPGQLFDDVEPKLSADGPDRGEMLRTMLDGLVAGRERDLRESAGVAKPGNPELERRRLRFAWRALLHTRALRNTAVSDDPFGTLTRLGGIADERCNVVNAEVLGRFEQAVEQLDLSEAADETLLGPFRWVAGFFDVTGLTESAVTTMISTIVETCWGLRRVGRDDIPEFKVLLELGAPFNDDLFDRLTRFDSAFGHNSRCADFLVFRGEKQKGDARRTTFEAGLTVCPGHRNSAMLLSYESLGDATKLITQVAMTPTLAAKMPGSGHRIEEMLRSAKRALDEAEEIYPYNESLPDAREALDKEVRRLHVDIDA